MSTATHTEGTHGETVHAHDDHAHSDKPYFMVAGVLAILTAIEVSTYFVDFGELAVPTLLVLMVIKFVMVVLFFMHLKDDSKILSAVFGFGLGLALAVYLCTLIASQFWA